ncbi:MAG: protein kinase, partial [Planctomycetota bacterium]|nr:protein kinase [Planctomycetota bacterium]
CHEHNVIHRDVKPQNILIENETERAVLVDFGLRKKLQEDSKGLTKTGEILGTPAFMSPEQFSPGGSYGDVGQATDVWAFGATIFFALAGKSPFEKGTMVEIFQAISIDPPPTLQSIDPSIPDWLNDLCSECLQKQADARPTMAEVSQRLDEQSLDEPVQGKGVKIALKFIAISAVLLVATIAGLFFTTLIDDAPLEFSKLDENPKVTRESSIQLRGRINGTTIPISAGGGKGLSDENGDFKVRVQLKQEGMNRIRFLAQDEQKVVSSTIDIFRDTTPPKIEVKLKESTNKEKIVFVDKNLKGKVTDKTNIVKFTINKQAVTLVDGAFEYPLRDKAEAQSMVLIAEDSVGNKSSLECKVYTSSAQLFQSFSNEQRSKLRDYVEYRAKTPEDKRAMLVLANNRLWAKSTDELQDRAISIVGARIGSDFQLTETKKRECGPFNARIATFKHKKTGIEFQLIPGSLKKTAWWKDPLFEYTINFLEALASEDSNQSLIRMSLMLPPSSDYINAVLRFMGRKGTQRSAMNPVMAYGLSSQIRAEDLPKFRAWFKQRIKLKMQEKLKKDVTDYIPPFLIGKRELSIGQWTSVAKLPTPPPGIMGGSMSWSSDPDYPMFSPHSLALQWLKNADRNFRLPSRHEWIIAAQGGSDKRFFWGDDISKIATYGLVSTGDYSTPEVTTVHDNHLNAYGLADVYGNVSEWVDPDWDSWRRAWPRAKPTATLFKGYGDENALKWGLSMGGFSYTPGLLCQSSMVFFQPVLTNHPFMQRIGLRVSVSIP